MTAQASKHGDKAPLDMILEYVETENYDDLFSFFATQMEKLEHADTDMILSLSAMLANFGYYEKVDQVFSFLEKNPFLKNASFQKKIEQAYLNCAMLHLEANQEQMAIECLKKSRVLDNQEDLATSVKIARIFLNQDQPAAAFAELEAKKVSDQKHEAKDQSLFFLLKGLLSFELREKNQALLFWEKAKKTDFTKKWFPLLDELEQLASS